MPEVTQGITQAEWTKLRNASDHLTWWQNRGELRLYFYLSILFFGEILNGYDGTVLGGLLALPKWNEDLGYPSAARVGLLNAAPYITGVIMGPINSWVADRYGRQWPIRWYAWTMLVGTVLGCVAGIRPSSSYGLFVASRLIIGSGNTTFLMTAPIIMQEVKSHPRNRGFMCALWATQWLVGSVIASFVCFGCTYVSTSWSWRIPYLIQVVPCVYMIVAGFLVPETPRFLMARGRESAALDFFVQYHGNGDPNDELVQFEYRELQEALERERSAKSIGWMEILKGKGNQHRLGLVCLMTFLPQMNGGNIIYYYYSYVLTNVGITSPSAQTGIGAGLSVLGFFSQLAGAWALKWMRRRNQVLWTWPMCAVALAAMAIAGAYYEKSGGTNGAAGIAGVVMVWLFQIPNNFVSPLFYSYPTEILNYAIRAKGMAVWNTFNQGWGAFSSFVNSIALDSIGWKYYCVYIPLIVAEWIVSYFYMVETVGYTLEEIAVAFEGPDAAILMVDAVPLSESAQMDLKGEKEDEISIEHQAKPAEIA